jgi:hypothetical protein
VRDFWAGRLPLGQAFWLWGIIGGGVVNLFTTLLALALITFRVPGWVALAVMLAPIPWNVGLAVGVWRSAGRPGVGQELAALARTLIIGWVVLISML